MESDETTMTLPLCKEDKAVGSYHASSGSSGGSDCHSAATGKVVSKHKSAGHK